MTPILHLPEEVLLMIFKKLYSHSLDHCQYVCRAWYLPAHLLLLKEVDLYKTSQVERFITAIDHNPKQSYLNAVKTLDIYDSREATDDPPGIPFSTEKIHKLFCRFPNLKKVELSCSFLFLQEFDDNVCNDVLESCPKLDKFEVELMGDENLYCDALYRVRSLVTFIEIAQMKNLSRFGDSADFITSFPRLQTLSGVVNTDNIHIFFVRVIQHLPKLISFNITCTRDDDDAFIEGYLAPKTKEEQAQVIQRLSNIERMTFNCVGGYFLNSIMFIVKYMKGLKFFRMACRFTDNWSNVKQQLFCNLTLDLIHSIKEFDIDINMKLEVLQECLPIIAYKVFQRPAFSTEKHVLRIKVIDNEEYRSRALVSISNIKESEERRITVKVSNDLSLQKIAFYLFKKCVPLYDIDTFELTIKQRDRDHYNQRADTQMYDKLFNIMPSLNQVTLDVPQSFKEEQEDEDVKCDDNYSKVEKLTLRARPDTKFQALLNSSYTMFPNLKHLNLYYFCGQWKKRFSEFQLDLAEYSLESLTVDVTPIKKYSLGNFFVVEVFFLNDSDRYLFKIPNDLSTVTRIQYTDLKGLTRGTDYYQVNIVINNLESLRLCKYKGTSVSDNHNYIDESSHLIQYLTLFNKEKQ